MHRAQLNVLSVIYIKGWRQNDYTAKTDATDDRIGRAFACMQPC